jgi:hypothetical protein
MGYDLEMKINIMSIRIVCAENVIYSLVLDSHLEWLLSCTSLQTGSFVNKDFDLV